jgi:molecular chaperone GrpE (heat shock protein)
MDPFLHEVLIKEDSEKEEDEVTEELLPGYMLKDKVIRHSKVKIAKNSKVKQNG